MGSFLSLPGSKGRMSDYSEISQVETYKRQRMSSSITDENPRLIPTLPDEISIQILARLSRNCYLNMKLVSQSWKTAMTSSELLQLRKELGTAEDWLYMLTKVDNKLLWHALNPLSRRCERLPSMPNIVYEEESKKGLSVPHMWNMVSSSIKIADVIRRWFGRKNMSDQMQFSGFAIASLYGCLYVLGGFSRASTLRCVWRYDPCVNMWSEVTPMNVGRAYCMTCILNYKLYVVGGVSRGAGGLTTLQSAEVFDPNTGVWTQIPSMPFARAQVLPIALLVDMLKPIATGMTSYRGKLCVPQSLYSWLFIVDIGGEIYDPETDSWTEMPAGMGDGWPATARQVGTKLNAVVNGELYALDPSSSLDSANIKIYDRQEDDWKVVIDKVPIQDFADSESPYLFAGFLGKLHVVTKDANHDIVVLQADLEKHIESSPSTSSSPPGSDPSAEAETDIWKAIATFYLGSAELIACQVSDM